MIFIGGNFIMKKIITIASIIFCTFIFSSCQMNINSHGNIKQKSLTKEETNLLKLMGLDDKSRVYDNNLDKDVKSIHINIHTLDENLKWKNNGSMSSNVNSLNGTIGVLKDDNERLQVSYKDQDEISIFKSNLDVYDDIKEKSRSIWWNDKANIEYEKEIPLAIQVITSSNEIRSFSGESFYEPDRLKGHDEVIALTVKFSKTELE